MGKTIFKTILEDNILQDNQNDTILSGIIAKHTECGVIDGQAIYDKIRDLDGWCKPSPGNETTEIEDVFLKECRKITLSDGTPAGIFIFDKERFDRLGINIFEI